MNRHSLEIFPKTLNRSSLRFRSLDITNREQRKNVVDEIVDRFGCIDVLINNAGFTYRAVMEHVTETEKLKQMEINFRAPMELIRVTLPAMRKKSKGLIIKISSVGGMMALPTMSIYSASKFVLEGANEALYLVFTLDFFDGIFSKFNF